MNSSQLKQLEADLGAVADNLRANSGLKSSQYSTPVLGIIFLKFADVNYKKNEAAILQEYEQLKGTRREKPIHEIALVKCGFYLPAEARYDYLLNLSEDQDIAKALEHAMEEIEKYKPDLEGCLPKAQYYDLTSTEEQLDISRELLRSFDNIPDDVTGDIFGQIYEYFLGRFALAEGQGGGEFYTPKSVVQLMVEIIEPHGGKVFDPACGSGGMFVQSAKFIEKHKNDNQAAGADTSVFVCGQEKERETVRLARMNLAVQGLRGDIRQGISYYEDHHNSLGQFDYVLANPPFNVDDVSLSSVENDPRFNTYGIPRKKSKGKKSEQGKETVPNANYLWINLFATALKEKSNDHPGGRAGLVMANSASDARHSEADIRQTLVEKNLIYGMLSLPSNMFYTVTLPATLWFFDKGKTDDRFLFIDARNIFTQIDRAHREFSEEQIQNIAIISRLHKGRSNEYLDLIDEYFASGMSALIENKDLVPAATQKILEVLSDEGARGAADSLVQAFGNLSSLQDSYDSYLQGIAQHSGVESRNTAQKTLIESFDPFFERLHDSVKKIGKAVREHEKSLAEAAKADGKRVTNDRSVKLLKSSMEDLHRKIKASESYFGHIAWLQERFPEAKYEDVTGLCKLASFEEVKEQDYSLNPGRYVGVVIEDDGKTEEEFIDEILLMRDKLRDLSMKSEDLQRNIFDNLTALSESNS